MRPPPADKLAIRCAGWNEDENVASGYSQELHRLEEAGDLTPDEVR